ncbi:hypothetical protein GCM10028808_72840 [Spirosoma migulaei]
MPISVRFTIRKHYDTLLCRLSVDGAEGSLFSPTRKGELPIIFSGLWNQKQQKRTDRTNEATDFNKQLRELVTTLETLYSEQRKLGFVVSPKTIQREFQTGEKPQAAKPPAAPKNTLIEAYRAHIVRLKAYKGTDNELSGSTIEKWKYGLSYLETYLKAQGEEGLIVDYVGVGWSVDYHVWLMKTGPMSADSATRYLKRISESIDGYNDRLSPMDRQKAFNPIAGMKFGRGKSKEVHFLEKPHLAKFWQLDNRGKGGECIWWMGLIFLTAMDYPDAVRYIKDRPAYDREGNTRPSILIHRDKPPKALCRIPVWPELTALLEHIPAGDPPSADEINDYMKGVEVMINYPHRLTCKTGRRTGGYIFLLRGYTIRAVSRIMGHSSIAVTERYYVKVTSELVEQETDLL